MPGSASEHSCSYIINRGDCLVAVDNGWKEFALENDGGAALPNRILRSCLWDHISGMENRLIYKKVLDCVRGSSTPIRLTFRCDSPNEERRLEMFVGPMEEQCCIFKTSVLEHRPRPHVALLDSGTERTRQSVSICGWCMNLKVSRLDWIPLAPALGVLGLDPDGPLPHLLYTICPDCSQQIDRLLVENDYPGLATYRKKKKVGLAC